MHYVRNTWYVACWSHDIESSKPFSAKIMGEPVVIYRGESGRLVALEDRCIHRLAPLSLGRCEGDNIRCMYHGLLFDAMGKAIDIPGQDLIPQQARVKRYSVADKHSWIWVWMGNADLADESLIPPVVGFDNPNYLLGHGQIDYAAEARLINDNLLDFSHLAYVHKKSFGASDEWARQLPKIAPLERGVHFEKWTKGEINARTQATEVMDRFTNYDYVLPGILMMQSGNFPLGSAKTYGDTPPDFEDAVSGVTFTSQAVTPLTEKTARYFYMWGPRRDLGGEAYRDTLMQIAGVAFAEDREMIESQQRVMDITPDWRVMPISSDKGLVMFNRLVDRMILAETNRVESAA